MKRKLIAGSLAALVVAGGTAGAIAASNAKDDEQAVLADAAKRLGVGTDELRDALSEAEDAQLDAAVKAGRITQAQADEIKQHRADEGTVLGLGGHRGGPGFGGPTGFSRETLAAAAKALGVSESKLFSKLRAGDADARAAVKTAATASLAQKLKAGDITQAQHDEVLDHLDELIEHLGDGPPGFGHHGGPGGLDDAIAKAIGISEDKLETQLRAGKTISAIAKANGKTLADVKAALEKSGDVPPGLIDHLDDFGRFGGRGPGGPPPGFRHP